MALKNIVKQAIKYVKIKQTMCQNLYYILVLDQWRQIGANTLLLYGALNAREKKAAQLYRLGL